MVDKVEIRRGTYYDSVRLMQASTAVQHSPGVEDALVAMATGLNLDLYADMGFDTETVAGARPDDLIVAIRTTDDGALDLAMRALTGSLQPVAEPRPGMLTAPPGHLVGSVDAGANLALISVPGDHAFVEAMDALSHGLHVMIFSDNVPLAQEVALKQTAEKAGLLVMGPDCGTAIVNGVGLGFANAVMRGPVGIVGAAGTGIQQICCLLDEADVGVRHALGTGSGDLLPEVAASSTLKALRSLDDDPGVEVIVVVSKPPAPEVAQAIRTAADACSTPTVMALLGERDVTLEGAVRATLEMLGRSVPAFPSWPIDESHRPGFIRGLFAGGSLRAEAAEIISVLGPVGNTETTDSHALIDYGAAEYTRGRAHPMIDQKVRMRRLEAAARDPLIGVILLDVVLGFGAHPDPASELAPVIEMARTEGAAVLVSLCGSKHDPQDRDRQIRILDEAGASVWLSNAAAARHAVSLVERTRP